MRAIAGAKPKGWPFFHVRTGLPMLLASLACAASGGRSHPVAALWPVALRRDLRRALEEEGVRKVGAYLFGYLGPRREMFA